MARQLLRCIAVAALCLLSLSAVQAQHCTDPPAHSNGTLQYCHPIVNYPVHTDTSFLILDAMAKQTADVVLNQIINCKGVFVTSKCSRAIRAYTCSVNFPQCLPQNGTLIRPCRSMCEEYCTECFVDSCPCVDLPEVGCFKRPASVVWPDASSAGSQLSVAASSVLVMAVVGVASLATAALRSQI